MAVTWFEISPYDAYLPPYDVYTFAMYEQKLQSMLRVLQNVFFAAQVLMSNKYEYPQEIFQTCTIIIMD